ncbi:MAG TPA: 3-methyl-2-oxobutanoate hydroxymethyltransferase [bacterium]|nr:3-methyl-2-oxobutanoate hydroxymethyltransferase [bacterium]HNT65826.1 3-methyl-2-oxobutanoate hydroxymethyltransferase [bacterium]HOX85668.1 3-methyl-2-oxobutanoate hydroxymethyltransferase [bacterium]HPG44827.1 3-methyl-2-oxobutanoate hydroxymethyltransferase [bacterium]HPM98144.1 3-methyl-2-oxobutanoate hydroxymethyltransferase [bacterium]
MQQDKLTVPAIVEMKRKGEKITSLTAYDALFAKLLDQAGVDVILVGDSCAMVFQGEETTLPFTMEEAIYHSRVVRRGVQRALLVADMPFMSYQVSTAEAMHNAGLFFKKALVDAVKIEGGRREVETIAKIVAAGMPVMGHLGLTPQSIRAFGTYSVQARSEAAANDLLLDAQALQDAGVFAVVLEKIPEALAKKVTEALDIPTIGIGAGVHCDGQVLVAHDALGLFTDFKPKFVRRYAELAETVVAAVQNYCRDVKAATFPSSDESYR